MSEDSARDTIQSFVLDRIIAGSLLSKADPHRGRLRSLLFAALKHFIHDIERRGQSPTRRPSGGLPVSLHAVDAGGIATEAVPDVFDRLWARQVIRLALDYTKKECEGAGEARYWELFEARVLLPIFCDRHPEPYTECVQRLGFRSPTEASNALTTVKRRIKRAVETLISNYAGASEVANELSILREIVGRSAQLIEELGGTHGAAGNEAAKQK